MSVDKHQTKQHRIDPLPKVTGRDDFASSRETRRTISMHIITELNSIRRGSSQTNARRIAAKLVDQAVKGEPFAIQTILDRVEGKPEQQVKHAHEGSISIRSAALSQLATLIGEATGRRPDFIDADVVPEGSVLSAPLCVQADGHAERMDISEDEGSSEESERLLGPVE